MRSLFLSPACEPAVVCCEAVQEGRESPHSSQCLSWAASACSVAVFFSPAVRRCAPQNALSHSPERSWRGVSLSLSLSHALCCLCTQSETVAVTSPSTSSQQKKQQLRRTMTPEERNSASSHAFHELCGSSVRGLCGRCAWCERRLRATRSSAVSL